MVVNTSDIPPFQSQVAILGWGYGFGRQRDDSQRVVSIAGGDSWVGIQQAAPERAQEMTTFQSQVAILGWGYPPRPGVPPSSSH